MFAQSEDPCVAARYSKARTAVHKRLYNDTQTLTTLHVPCNTCYRTRAPIGGHELRCYRTPHRVDDFHNPPDNPLDRMTLKKDGNAPHSARELFVLVRRK